MPPVGAGGLGVGAVGRGCATGFAAALACCSLAADCGNGVESGLCSVC